LLVYDGFIGPGAGSFFVVRPYCFNGFDFHASANAKMVNLATNFGSMLFMIKENNLGNCFANGR
jgi:hypothetical protein